MSGFDSAQASSSDSCREHRVTDRDDVGDMLDEVVLLQLEEVDGGQAEHLGNFAGQQTP
jgi:hypothetical protein